MTIDCLNLKDFGSIQSAGISYTNVPVAIVGENLTDDNQASNGVGKSFLLQGLFYAIYGDNLRKTIDRKLIRRGTEKAELSVTISCKVRKEKMVITRTIPMKGSATLGISINGNDIPYGTVNEGNRMIVQWLGISSEDARTYFIISKENYRSFFTASNTEKLALISRFINFSDIDRTKAIIESAMEDVRTEIRAGEKEMSSWQGKIEVWTGQLESISEESFENGKRERISKIEEAVTRERNKKTALEASITNSRNHIGEIRGKAASYSAMVEQSGTKLKELVSTMEQVDELLKQQIEVRTELDGEMESVRKDKTAAMDERSARQVQIRKLDSLIKQAEATLEGAIICPSCGHHFLLEEGTSIEETRKRKLTYSKQKKSYEAEEKEYVDKIEDCTTVIEEYKTASTELSGELSRLKEKYRNVEESKRKLEHDISFWKGEVDSSENRIRSIEGRIKIDEADISLCDTNIESYRKQIEGIEKEAFSSMDGTKKELSKNITSALKSIDGISETIGNFEAEISGLQQWIVRFREFKMFLAVEQIKNIQAEANEVLESMGSDLRLMIEAFKLDSKGQPKEELTPYIFRDSMESYWHYSGGERARAEIALIIALQNLINATNPYGGLHFLQVDEVLDASDALGIESIIRSLSFLNQPCLITTQIPRLNEEIEVMTVVKENGISFIK